MTEAIVVVISNLTHLTMRIDVTKRINTLLGDIDFSSLVTYISLYYFTEVLIILSVRSYRTDTQEVRCLIEALKSNETRQIISYS